MAAVFSFAYADIDGNGYYRVRNYGSSRWASMVDNTGSVDMNSSAADLHALQLNNNTQQILSDPGSIVYITNIGGRQYDVASQGVSLQNLVNNTISIGAEGTGTTGQQLYRIYGVKSGVTKFISDGQIDTSMQFGEATINDLNSKYKSFSQWEFIKLDVAGDNYFGAVPTLEIGNDLYATLFTSFAYQPYSSGVEVYYIGRVGYGMAELKKINDAVPTGSPVIVKCAGRNVSDNRMQITGTETVLPNNSLSGVYFNFKQNNIENRIVYDPATMRVLGKCSDGSLGFITSNLDYLPANTAYLRVPAGSSPEFKCVSTEEYDLNIPQAPEQIYSEDGIVLLPQDDYTYTGTIDIPEMAGNQSSEFRFYTDESKSESSAIGVYIDFGKNYSFNLINTMSLPFSYNSPYSWILTNWDGGEINITLNLQYRYVKFDSKKADVNALMENDFDGFKFDGDAFLNATGGKIIITNLAGAIVAKSNSGSLKISNLPKGVYVAFCEGKSIKFIR